MTDEPSLVPAGMDYIELGDLLHELRHAEFTSETVAITGKILRAIRAHGDACTSAAVALEREWWREITAQLIACHDETCPAVMLVKDRLSGDYEKDTSNEQ